MSVPPPASGLRVPRQQAAQQHALLEDAGCLNRDWRPVVEQHSIVWPLLDGAVLPKEADGNLVHLSPDCWTRAPPPIDPHHRLREAVEGWLKAHRPADAHAHEALLDDLPQRWERLGDLVLLPASSFGSPAWQRVLVAEPTRPWKDVLSALKASRLGLQNVVASDTIRTSGASLLVGEHGEIDMLDHGVRFRFDATRQMFSSGNVTERHRMGSLNLSGETVVDAFSGIGYYTLPMLVRGRAAHVHACDINPEAAAWLLKGAQANGVDRRLTQHVGDNGKTLPALQGLADRVVLGLLPSSEDAWDHAVRCLKPGGGLLHVHMNVEEERIEAWATSTATRFGGKIEHLERVKWYAPRIRHAVLDVRIS